MQSLLAYVRSLADTGETLPALPYKAFREFGDTGQRQAYERPLAQRRARLVALGVSAMLDPERPADELSEVLWSTCAEYTWTLPAHLPDSVPLGWGPAQSVDLMACETAFTLAEIVAALDDQLDATVSARVREEIERRIFVPFTDPRPLPWEGFGNNWEAVCAGGAGLAALAILAHGPRRDAILGRCKAAMRRFVDGYGEDGGCVEGIGYWVYGFGHFVYFAEALREHTGEDLLSEQKVLQMARFPERIAFSTNAFASFSDAVPSTALPAGLMARLAERFGTGLRTAPVTPAGPHDLRWGHCTRTLSWYAETPAAELPAATSYLPSLGWLIDRGTFGFAAKGGHNDEPHNHVDLGHFVLHVNGESILDDLGAGEYTRAYFREGRYDALHPSANGHSIPVIDGHSQAPGRDSRAEVLHFSQVDGGVDFVLDLSAAYRVPGLEKLVRRFSWQRSGRLELIDELDAGRDLVLEEVFISRHEPILTGESVRWANAVTLTYRDMSAAVERLDVKGHRGVPETVYRVRLTGTAPAGRSQHHFLFDLH